MRQHNTTIPTANVALMHPHHAISPYVTLVHATSLQDVALEHATRSFVTKAYFAYRRLMANCLTLGANFNGNLATLLRENSTKFHMRILVTRQLTLQY